jgi:serine/threonine protein kinase
MAQLFLEAGRPVILGQKLGSGGEADVFAIANDSSLVAKVYHNASAERIAKLRIMVGNPPDDPTISGGHISICWPTRLLFDSVGTGAGFLMRRVDYASGITLFKVYNPIDRQRFASGLTWRYLMRISANIARSVEAIHRRGCVVGDLNESNILVTNTALVTFVDCDSMQVPNPITGRVFRCPVGKAEFTPPELQGKDFSGIDRGPAQDNFGLAVLIFLLTMEGVHPFSGVWKGSGDPPTIEERIRLGESPYIGSRQLSPMRVAPPFEIIPAELQNLFIQCFKNGQQVPNARPSPRDWYLAFESAEANLKVCSKNTKHVFGNHLNSCPWCERTKVLSGFDPFGSQPQSFGSPMPPPQIPLRPATPIWNQSRIFKETAKKTVNYSFIGVLLFWIWHPILLEVFQTWGVQYRDASVLSVLTFISICTLIGYWNVRQQALVTAAPFPPNPGAQPRPFVKTIISTPTPQTSSSTYSQVIVASRIRNKYHRPSCKWALKISRANRVVFSSASDALAAGYRRCNACQP